MRIKKCRLFISRLFILFLGVIFAQVAKVSIAFAQEQSFQYDSSIQRSNFSTINPNYLSEIDDKIKNRRAAFIWNLRFDSQTLQTDKNNQSQIVGATTQTKFKYKIAENLDFKAKANLGLESGRSQSIFGDLEPSSGIYPREIKLEFRPIENIITLNFGQIHQRWLNEPLFIGNLGFPGASQKIEYKNEKIRLSATTQQLLPTSSTLSTRVSEKERMPNLFTETIDATWNISRNNFIIGSITHYKYNNLPSIVAYESFVYGNTVNAPDQKNSNFIYDFNGFLYKMTFEQKISNSLSAQFRWNTIINNKAPSTNGEAQSLTGVLANDFGRWIISGSYEKYFIESDPVPAFYNTHLLGHNNREGNSFELNFESKDWGVIFKTSYTKADLLNQTVERVDGLQQNNLETFYFSVETMYDFI
jgi:hypothetical protein